MMQVYMRIKWGSSVERVLKKELKWQIPVPWISALVTGITFINLWSSRYVFNGSRRGLQNQKEASSFGFLFAPLMSMKTHDSPSLRKVLGVFGTFQEVFGIFLSFQEFLGGFDPWGFCEVFFRNLLEINWKSVFFRPWALPSCDLVTCAVHAPPQIQSNSSFSGEIVQNPSPLPKFSTFLTRNPWVYFKSTNSTWLFAVTISLHISVQTSFPLHQIYQTKCNHLSRVLHHISSSSNPYSLLHHPLIHRHTIMPGLFMLTQTAGKQSTNLMHFNWNWCFYACNATTHTQNQCFNFPLFVDRTRNNSALITLNPIGNALFCVCVFCFSIQNSNKQYRFIKEEGKNELNWLSFSTFERKNRLRQLSRGIGGWKGRTGTGKTTFIHFVCCFVNILFDNLH